MGFSRPRRHFSAPASLRRPAKPERLSFRRCVFPGPNILMKQTREEVEVDESLVSNDPGNKLPEAEGIKIRDGFTMDSDIGGETDQMPGLVNAATTCVHGASAVSGIDLDLHPKMIMHGIKELKEQPVARHDLEADRNIALSPIINGVNQMAPIQKDDRMFSGAIEFIHLQHGQQPPSRRAADDRPPIKIERGKRRELFRAKNQQSE